jgi:HNH endonuclease
MGRLPGIAKKANTGTKSVSWRRLSISEAGSPVVQSIEPSHLSQLKRLNLTHHVRAHQGCILELGDPRDVKKIRTAFDRLGAKLIALTEEIRAAGFMEGDRKLLREHLVRERNQALVDLKKKLERESTGRLACEYCGFDFRAYYGKIGEGYIQAHHKRPIYELTRGRRSSVNDLELVCGNCHPMLHRGLKPAKLRRLLSTRRRSNETRVPKQNGRYAELLNL